MKPEQKVVSLETAKKLKEAGFPQDMERVWYHQHDKDEDHGWTVMAAHYGNEETFDAPDAQEIGELLPAHFAMEKFNTPPGSWWCTSGATCGDFCSGHESESEARAAAWLWLKEQKLV